MTDEEFLNDLEARAAHNGLCFITRQEVDRLYDWTLIGRDELYPAVNGFAISALSLAGAVRRSRAYIIDTIARKLLS